MMLDLLLLLAVAVPGVGVFFLVRILGDRSRLARRLRLAEGKAGEGEARLSSRLTEGMAGARGGLERVFTALGALMPLGEDDRRKIAVGVERAGFQSSNAVTIVLGAKFTCLLLGLAAGILMLSGYLPGVLGIGVGIIGGFLIGVLFNLLPEMIVSRLAASRLWRIQSALPDALDLLIVCLEAGLTFERALRRTVNDLKTFQPTLAAELGQASLDMSVHGRTREDALGRVAERLDSQDLRDLTTTVVQSERHGTPVADALRKLANSVRVQTISRMQTKMARLPTMLVLPSIACLLPGILVLVGGPSMLKLMNELGGMGI